MNAKFQIYKSSQRNSFYFRLIATNAEIILSSEGYTTIKACQNGVEAVRRNSQDDNKYNRRTTLNGKYYFNLKAANGQIIGTSNQYHSKMARDKRIDWMKSNTKYADMEDLSD